MKHNFLHEGAHFKGRFCHGCRLVSVSRWFCFGFFFGGRGGSPEIELEVNVPKIFLLCVLCVHGPTLIMREIVLRLQLQTDPMGGGDLRLNWK